MYFKTLPKKGDKIKMTVTQPDFESEILDVFPYTGRYTDMFTHVIRYTSPMTRRGWMEIPIKIDD